ncbi:MAG: hypothetical protein KF752_19935 [Pirellulaceae bacterium]|nr:hypothetical protein [Pirellulaceae bacterium]
MQIALDVGGFAPGIGILFDLANAGVSLGRGNDQEALINLLASIPGFGDAAKLAKMAAAGGGAGIAAAVALSKLNKATTELHHAWPKYLGGPLKQDLVEMPKALHQLYHSGLDKILPRQWGKNYFDNLSATGRAQLAADLAAYTKAFDLKHGTNLWQSMLNNGFPGL